jgi:hypothetical protein
LLDAKERLDIVIVHHRDTGRKMPENSFELMPMSDGPEVDDVRDLYANLRKRLDRYAIIGLRDNPIHLITAALGLTQQHVFAAGTAG